MLYTRCTRKAAGREMLAWVSISDLHEIAHTMMALSRLMYDSVISVIRLTKPRSSCLSVVLMMPGCGGKQANS